MTNNFKNIIDRALQRDGKNKSWLAESIGVSNGTLSRYFKNPTLDTIRRIDAVLPLPEAAGLLHPPDVLAQLETLTREFADVLNDPAARADFDGLVQAIAELSPQQRRGLLLFLQSSDKPQ